MKNLIITIDTEGDNLWNWKSGDVITTRNTLFLDRFQKMCEWYGFKPTWLANWEMIEDIRFVDMVCGAEDRSMCEIGAHLHAWNNPPSYYIDGLVGKGAPYLIEYPEEIMDEKVSKLTGKIYERTGKRVTSHRAGRWAMNDVYFDVLKRNGYLVDCSVTPGINWGKNNGATEGSFGADYAKTGRLPYIYRGIYEIPVTIESTHRLFIENDYSTKGIARSLYHVVKKGGHKVWLRPNGHNLNEMKWLIEKVTNSESDYIMFMLHSSELMPGGSPTFRSKQSIEKLYEHLELIFSILVNNYRGVTITEYYNMKNTK